MNNFQIHPVMHNVQNFICLGTECKDSDEFDSDDIKAQWIIFYVMCDIRTNIEPETGCGRHDLLASVIKRMFNRKNYFGTECILIEERESVTDNDYATRTLIFECQLPKNIVRSEDGVPYSIQ